MASIKRPLNLPLRIAIAATGEKQRVIARRARLAEDALSAILNGWRPGTRAEHARIAKALGKPVAELFLSL